MLVGDVLGDAAWRPCRALLAAPPNSPCVVVFCIRARFRRPDGGEEVLAIDRAVGVVVGLEAPW